MSDHPRRHVNVAAIQMPAAGSREENVARAEAHVREAAARGAQVILLPELFAGPYFCQLEDEAQYGRAESVADSRLLAHFAALARELEVVLPLSFYERSENTLFNSIAILDADGTNLGVYRKAHIPDGPGYEEKFYFTPGDTPFRVWQTRYARIGVLICWDQWFPEPARILGLQGAELLFYPTAIGSEPQDAEMDSMGHWRRVMQGHAAANLVPVIASNRIGHETMAHAGWTSAIDFYGSSFISDESGALLQDAGRETEEILVQGFDLDLLESRRLGWGLYRDRRPSLYGPLLSYDGRTPRDG